MRQHFFLGLLLSILIPQVCRAELGSCHSILLHDGSFETESGNGQLRIHSRDFFTSAYLDRLYRESPMQRRFALIDQFQKALAVDADLFGPLYRYAQVVIDLVNAKVSSRERGRLHIEHLALAKSDGSMEQVDENWHVDARRYMTVLVNLLGAGTLYDAAGPQPHMEDAFGWKSDDPARFLSLPAGEGLVINGGLRQALFDGPGTYSLAHRAPNGKEHIRMGLVMFIAAKGMITSQLGQGYILEFGAGRFEAFRQSALQAYFPILNNN